jgi:hypothetical protein
MSCQYTSSWGDKTPMSIGRNILMHMLGRPEGVLGRLGGGNWEGIWVLAVKH